MADADYNAEEAAELKKKRTFRKFSFRGIDLDQLLDLSSEQLRDVVHARARRRFNRGLKVSWAAFVVERKFANDDGSAQADGFDQEVEEGQTGG